MHLHLPLPSAGRATSPCPASPHLRRPRASCLAQNTAPLVPSARRSSAASTHLLVLAQALFRPYPTASPAAAKDTPVRPLLRRPVLAGASIQPPIAKLLVSSSCSSFVWFHFLFPSKFDSSSHGSISVSTANDWSIVGLTFVIPGYRGLDLFKQNICSVM